jgi:hypothetical protein
LEHGKPLSTALSRYPGYFSESYVSSIAFAERDDDPQDLALTLCLLSGQLSYTPPPPPAEHEEPYLDFYARRKHV